MKMKKNRAKMKNKKDQAIGLNVHLKELRKRLVAVAIAFVIVMLAVFQFTPSIVDHFVTIAVDFGYRLVYLAPAELFAQYIKVALVISLAVLIPFIIYQIWAFCSPGLSKKERRYFLGGVSFGLVFFVVGIAFAYTTILPFMLRFFFEVNTSSMIEASISVSNYVSFIISTLLMFGLIFEMPVLISILSLIGLLNANLLIKGRKFVIVMIFLVCAIITPPDVVSQIMTSIPMILLFELSIGLSKVIGKRKAK